MARIRGAWADAYRQKWTWDTVSWGSHSVDCYPGGCPWRVFVKDGKVVREEQAGRFAPIEPGVPDMNPMGCQKGACWSQLLDAPDRVTQPLHRVNAPAVVPAGHLLNTHRGEPFAFINDQDAARLGTANGELVKLTSEVGELRITAKLSPACRPGQVIVTTASRPSCIRTGQARPTWNPVM